MPTIRLVCVALLSVSVAPLSVPLFHTSWELRTSLSLLRGVQARTSGVRPLHLLDDLFDAESGLVSEGVWHNTMYGTACVLAARRLGQSAEADTLAADARRLGASLYDRCYRDGFRRRTATGIWQGGGDNGAAVVDAAGESAAFYAPSEERRSVSNAAAVILYSLLAEDEEERRGAGGVASVASRAVAQEVRQLHSCNKTISVGMGRK